MPLIVPLGEIFTPGGSEPAETFQVYGDVPPAAVKLAVYGVPVVPLANVLV